MVQAISEIIDNQKGARPIIVEFQNSNLQQGEEGKLLTGVYEKPNEKTVVAIASKNILYTGEINQNDDDDLYNRFLLVSNRKTGKVRLIAVDTTIVTPQLESKKVDDMKDTSTQNANTSINLLNKKFGSKKTKRITEQRERMKMNIEDVQEQLEQTVAGIEINETDSFHVDNTENDSVYRPPINRNASTREQVYVVSQIIPENVLDSLEEEAKNVLSTDLSEFEFVPIIEQKLGDLQNSSSANVLDKAKLLIYLEYLMRYIGKPAKYITKKVIICPTSTEVNNHILDTFSVLSNTGRTRPLSMRDKTICYILVLSMIAFDYEIDMEVLAKSLKIGVKKLQEIGRILAFSASGKSKTIMTLKIPLPAPVSVSPRKRRK